ncbi:hypothetical protein AMS68_006238 [Peltaster fructicola]|uniref:HTH CENPB-type domain-containing protein n=1 Tax=Peltaster fructicola TaxID=286661 RepID=A0A6H0Y1C5_9PEZI|nr:hypothetical protein AMS68_006238 [Peltaster fructicola]
MPQHHASSTRSKEDSIIAAIHAIDSGQYATVHRAAEAFNVPKSTLQARLNGRASRRDSIANHRNLTPTEEQMLLQKILDMDRRGFSPTHPQITEMASTILRARTGKSVGKRWSMNFVRRSPQLRTRMSRRLDYQRGKMEDPVVITKWFELVKDTIERHGILAADIYNFDETGFQLGQTQDSIVVTATDRKRRPKALGSGTTTWVTVVAGINATGWAVPPYIIFKAKEYNVSWSHDLPPDWRIGVSPNSCSAR